jgi:membrane-associated protein
MLDLLRDFIHVVLHLNDYLDGWVSALGPWMYLAMFAVVFCETGLVIMPFLPGDSLLFALGALCARPGSGLELAILAPLLLVAAITGDQLNYVIGRRAGPRIFHSETSRLLNKQHLVKAQAFYEKYGAKAIVIARFAPILRTFAPFVAGIGQMRFGRFVAYNVAGGVAWVMSFLLAGYFFGQVPAVKRNFHVVIVAIVVISLMPVAVEWWKARRATAATR